MSDNSKEQYKDQSSDHGEDYGYDFFPERDGKKQKTIMGKLIEGRSSSYSMKCVANVYWCMTNGKYGV